MRTSPTAINAVTLFRQEPAAQLGRRSAEEDSQRVRQRLVPRRTRSRRTEALRSHHDRQGRHHRDEDAHPRAKGRADVQPDR